MATSEQSQTEPTVCQKKEAPQRRESMTEEKAPTETPAKETTGDADDMKTDSGKAPEQSSTQKTADGKDIKDQHKTSADYYFDSYSHYGIHEEMLKDQIRTRTYMSSIKNNKHLFKGKTVLEVGAGTGIMCLFAAQAGAAKVVGIECASIALRARAIVKANGYENIITIVKGKVEEVDLMKEAGIDKVDIIISEWMGYFLLYESMLDTVIYARDKWMKPGGILMPDKASMYFCGIEDAAYKEQKVGFWQNVYGFDMSVMCEDVVQEPLVDTCPCNAVITDVVRANTIDLYTVTREELNWSGKFTMTPSKNDYMHAIVGFFNVEFTKCHIRTGFSTGPFNQYTHWKQTVFYLDDDLMVSRGDKIECDITVNRNAKNPRNLDINLSSVHKPTNSAIPETKNSRLYHMR